MRGTKIYGYLTFDQVEIGVKKAIHQIIDNQLIFYLLNLAPIVNFTD